MNIDLTDTSRIPSIQQHSFKIQKEKITYIRDFLKTPANIFELQYSCQGKRKGHIAQ
jgi:hypothetical protein